MSITDRALIAISLILFGVCSAQIGGIVAAAAERSRAIEAGVGRWVIDPTTGERRFTYGAGATTKEVRL